MTKKIQNPFFQPRDSRKTQEDRSVREPASGSCSRRRFLQNVSGVALAAGALGFEGAKNLAVAATPARAQSQISVGSRRQLLFDDFLLGLGSARYDSYPHNIRWTLGKVEKSPKRSFFMTSSFLKTPV